jgi:ElaB/YqjD/DUF883 family membrane-anchored ribosome-binding protein
MDTITPAVKPFGQDASRLADKAADTANGAIRSTQEVANDALDRLADKVEGVREQMTPLVDRLSAKAQDAADRGVDTVRETSARLRDAARGASDTATAYIKDEPLKAMLMAAATGAALMALITLSRSRAVN